MKETPEFEKFARKCDQLEPLISGYRSFYTDKEMISVLGHTLIKIVCDYKNPKYALEQIIDALRLDLKTRNSN